SRRRGEENLAIRILRLRRDSLAETLMSKFVLTQMKVSGPSGKKEFYWGLALWQCVSVGRNARRTPFRCSGGVTVAAPGQGCAQAVRRRVKVRFLARCDPSENLRDTPLNRVSGEQLHAGFFSQASSLIGFCLEATDVPGQSFKIGFR